MNLLSFNMAWLYGLYHHKHKQKAVSSKEQQRSRMGMAGCSANLQFTKLCLFAYKSCFDLSKIFGNNY